MDDCAPHYRYKGHTSDDTKHLELRPHKRPPIPSTNIDRHNSEWHADSHRLTLF
ncbi:hypothetical protein RhiirA5_439621 [Rhizophagus irregularis]|uniref:Uncharacterized protein n=1 Tax=Rhizophagus irregularis TaxID=588596 RepID=A0A2N0NHK7_9GLOM|nr:hypothetical protein RhiirA5_439621 [Rhizophagus irregularis]